MNDLEMTTLCSDAMGYHVPNFSNAPIEVIVVVGADGKTCTLYDPLHYDAQAMALVKRFQLEINTNIEDGKWTATEYESMSHGRDEDLNRTIVQCIAEMQQRKLMHHTTDRPVDTA